MTKVTAVVSAAAIAAATVTVPSGARAQDQPNETPTGTQPVGQPPPEREAERPDVQAIADVGGVLTPEGRLILEPTFQFSNSQVNRFTFLGTEILSTFLVGLIEAEEIDRDVVSAQLNARYGLSDRLEVGVKIPWISRREDREIRIPQADGGQSPVSSDSLSGEGLGDIELSAHAQLNAGPGPYYIANLRYKSDSGTGPFDVDFDDNGLEEELATGSGFQAIEPSMTVLMPSDPAVFYGNLGYVYNFDEDVDKTIGTGDNARRISKVEPGNSVRLSFGMAVSLNPQASFSIGYKHEFIEGTESEIASLDATTALDSETSDLQVGSLLFGLSHKVGRQNNFNLNLEVGATADAPDVVLSVSLPVTFGP